MSYISGSRKALAAFGGLALVALALPIPDKRRESLALAALIALVIAAILIAAEVTFRHDAASAPATRPKRWHWALSALVVTLAVGLSVQSWFHPGTTLAQGDIVPPDGTAWTARIFDAL